MLLLLPLLWGSVRADDSRAKDTYLEAFMESHATPNAGPSSSGAQQSPYPAASPQPQYGTPVSSPHPQYGPPVAPQPQYGSPGPQQQYGPPSGPPSPQPQYGPPSPQPQYGPPNPQPQYGPPMALQPQYGAPTPYGPATVSTTTSGPNPVAFFEGLGAGLWGLLLQLPLPDFHTALKILLKVILIKGVIKLISLVLFMLFIPKLEDIVTMVSSLLDMEMDMMPDSDKPVMKPSMRPDEPEDDADMVDDVPAEDASTQAESGRAGAARSRMLNAFAARVEEAISRTAAAMQTGSSDWYRCCNQTNSDVPPRKSKRKLVNKSAN